MNYYLFVDAIGRVIDICGILAIVFGIFLSLFFFVVEAFRKDELTASYQLLRRNLGRTTIIGLELLIAGDIIRSIAVPPSFTSIGVLAIIVLIRAFLTIQIEKDTDGLFNLRRPDRFPDRGRHRKEK